MSLTLAEKLNNHTDLFTSLKKLTYVYFTVASLIKTDNMTKNYESKNTVIKRLKPHIKHFSLNTSQLCASVFCVVHYRAAISKLHCKSNVHFQRTSRVKGYGAEC